MKRILAFAFTLVTVLTALTGCMASQNPSGNAAQYKVVFADNYPICNQMYETYAAGDQVEIVLETITEHSYTVKANGKEVEMDREKTNLAFTYYTFTMPKEDVLVEIESKGVEIPIGPEQSSTVTISLGENLSQRILSDPDQQIILEILGSDREWRSEIPECDWSCRFSGSVSVGYCDCGTISDFTNHRSRKLTVEEKGSIEALISRYQEEDPPIGYPYRDRRIWDRHHPDDRECDPYFSITVPELGDALIEHREDGIVYVNGERLFGGPGNGCESFYLADIDGDYDPELCFGMNWGSGIVDLNIVIYDYKTGTWIFSLSDRMHHDYSLFVRNGNLCVKEMEYMHHEAVRTGMFVYNGSEITVSWDEKPNTNADRDAEP